MYETREGRIDHEKQRTGETMIDVHIGHSRAARGRRGPLAYLSLSRLPVSGLRGRFSYEESWREDGFIVGSIQQKSIKQSMRGGAQDLGRLNGGWVQNRDFFITANQARRFSYLPPCVSKPRTAATST